MPLRRRPDVYQAEIYAKAPNQLATFVHQQEGDMVRTFDGRQGYFLLPLTVVEEYPWTGGAQRRREARRGAGVPGTNQADFLTNWRVGFSTTVNGKEVRVVQGTGPSGLLGTFYFDKDSGLLVRMVRYANSAVGRVPTQIDYCRLPAGRRRDDAVQVVVCVGERPRGIHDDRHPAERRALMRQSSASQSP